MSPSAAYIVCVRQIKQTLHSILFTDSRRATSVQVNVLLHH